MSHWVSIATFNTHVEAHFYATLLDSNGIPCNLADETMMTLFPIYNISLGGIKIQVREEDVKEAAEILSSQRPNTTSTSNKSIGPCPNCGSENVSWRQGFHLKLLRFFAAILYIPIPLRKGTTLQCQKCRYTFIYQH